MGAKGRNYTLALSEYAVSRLTAWEEQVHQIGQLENQMLIICVVKVYNSLINSN